MTSGQFRKVEFDLLADYVGGALDGTPDGTEIARLIDEDPAWAQAHADLRQGVDSVQTSLASWADTPAPMPPEVADRITAALAGIGPADTPARPTVQGRSRSRSHVAAPARRRWARLAGPVAIAVAVAGFAGFTVNRLVDSGNSGDATDTVWSAGDNDRPVAPDERAALSAGPQPFRQSSAERVLATGTDYARTTLPEAVRALDRLPVKGGEEDTNANTNTNPARLADHDALAGCLDAVAAAHDPGPVAVGLVDYAAFEGRPALVVVFTDQAGDRWVLVAGPDCGLPGSGADLRYQTRVG